MAGGGGREPEGGAAKISQPIVVGGATFFSILLGRAVFFTHYFCKLFFVKVTLHVL